MALPPLPALPGLPSLFGRGAGRAPSRDEVLALIPQLDDEEQRSALLELGLGIMGGVQYAAETFDKPGSAIRGLLAGDPGQLLNLIPFSDAMGLTDPRERVGGRDLLEKWGALGANTPGLDWGDVAGFGAEVLLDPLIAIRGPGGALTKAGLAASKKSGKFAAELAGKADDVVNVVDDLGKMKWFGNTPFERVQQIKRGERGLLSVQLPFASEPLLTMGTGDKAAQLAKAWYYNPVNRALRQTFTANPKLKGFSTREQIIADMRYSQSLSQTYEMMGRANKAKQILTGMDASFADQIQSLLGHNKDLADRLLGEGNDVANMSNQQFVRALGEARPNLSNVDPQLDSLLGGMDQVGRLRSLADEIGASGEFMDLAGKYDSFVDGLLGMKNQVAGRLAEVGYKLGPLDDIIGHVPRLLDEALVSLKRRNREWGRSGFGYATQRAEVLRGVPTDTINRISKDARLTAVSPDSLWANLDDRVRILQDEYNIGVGRELGPGERAPSLADVMAPSPGEAIRELANPQAVAAAEYFSKLPKEALAEGLFSRGVIDDVLQYSIKGMDIRGGIDAVHHLLLNTAKADPEGIEQIGPSLDTLFQQLDAKNPGYGFATDAGGGWFQNLWKTTHGEVPDLSKVHVPSEFADAATSMLGYHTNPKALDRLLGFYDDIHRTTKSLLTTPFPAFHNRNLISALWQNGVTAFRNPVHGARGIREAMNVLRGKGSKYLDEFQLHRGMPDEFLTEVKRSQKPVESLPGEVFYPTRALGRARQNLRDEGLFGITDEGRRVGFLDFIGNRDVRGGAAGNVGEWGQDLYSLVEFINRYSHYVARREAGWSPGMAAQSVLANHFDYAALAKSGTFQSQVLRRLVPFYGWLRFNTPKQLRDLMAEPGGPVAQTARLLSSSTRGARDDEFLPSWLRERVVIDAGEGETPGTRQYATLQGFLPIEDALGRVAFSGGLPDISRTLQKTLSNVAPILQWPFETATGVELYSGRPFNDLPPGVLDDRNLNNLLMRSPISRFISTGRKLTDERSNAAERAINALVGGFKFQNVDEDVALASEGKRLLTELLGEHPDAYTFSRLAVPREKLPNLSEEDLAMLSLYQWLNEQQRQAAKERKAAKK